MHGRERKIRGGTHRKEFRGNNGGVFD